MKIVILFLLYTSTILSQHSKVMLYDSVKVIKINPIISPLSFHISAEKYYSDDVYEKSFFVIYISSHKNQINQTIIDSTDTEYFKNIIFIDVNYDGYLDIGIPGLGDIDNIAYNFWIFNNAQNKFVFDSQYSDLFNPEFNTKDSTIISFVASRMNALPVFEKEKYKVISNNLVLIYSEDSTVESDNLTGKNYWIRTKSELVNGKMETTEIEKIDVDSLFYDRPRDK